jgi:nucleoside-diphosphate-sugar epimerase
MNILITGHLGFVGTATSKLLTEKNHAVYGFDLMENGDIRDPQQLDTVMSKLMSSGHQIDRILHLAAIARFTDADKDPLLAYETNARGTLNVSLVAAKYHIPIVYASTGSVYMPIGSKPPITEEFAAKGNSVYGCSKYVGELFIKKNCSPHFIILRYAHLYGKEKRMHGLIGGFVDRIKRGLAPTLYGGKQSNDFTYIKDVARANYLALSASWDKWNQIYNIGTGEELTAEEAGRLICEVTNWKGKIKKEIQRTVDPDRFVYDCKKAEIMLGFKAEFKFKDGLKDMFALDPKGK